jgi:hypothetical protein
MASDFCIHCDSYTDFHFESTNYAWVCEACGIGGLTY